MRYLLRGRNFWIVFSVDALLLFLAYVFSYFIRFEGHLSPIEVSAIKKTIWFIIPLKLLVFWKFKLYRGMWRYTSIADLINIIKATFVSSPTIVLIILFFYQFVGFSRGVFIIDAFLTILLISGARLSIRVFLQEASTHNNSSRLYFLKKMRKGLKRVLIIGAGDAGEMLLREMKQNPNMTFEPVGFLDDDPDKRGRTIHNVPVLGKIKDLKQIAQKKEIQEIIIAIPSITGKGMREIVEQCKRTGISCKTVPAMSDILNGKVHVSQIREIQIEDLLGREHIELDKKQIMQYLFHKRVLITGAGGSIGSELARQIAQFEPKLLALLDIDETALFYIIQEIKERHPSLAIQPILGDVADREKMNLSFNQFDPQIIFHAAAYKHVPILEDFPEEAVRVNILGTNILGKLSDQSGVEKFIFISTDKAVNPTSVMGVSKRVAEMVITHLNSQRRTQFIAVRFGNVLGSRGSVIPIFQEQIRKGGPVTVTHPEMRRYFITIPEAVLLVLQAGSIGEGGEVFVLDMGEQIKIYDMACELIRLSGLEPNKDIPIVFTGIRPGEKLFEEVLMGEEGVESTTHPKIFKARIGNSLTEEYVNERIERLEGFAKIQDTRSIVQTFHELIPNYQPNRNEVDEEE